MNQLTTLFTALTLLLTGYANSQDTLLVNCGTANSSPDWYYQNNIYLDSNLLAYGIGQGVQPGFMVTVFDTNCVAWDSLPFATSAQGQFITKSFKFDQDDPVLLADLDELINMHIPNNHPFVIYTPITYSGSTLSSLSPQLAQTFTNYWGPEAVQTESIMILFGIKGYPGSFEMDTLTSGAQLTYSTVICPHAVQTVSLDEHSSENAQITAKPNPSNTSITLEFSEDYESIEVLNLSGQCIQKHPVTQNELLLKGLPDGVYFVVGLKGAEKSEPLRIQFY